MQTSYCNCWQPTVSCLLYMSSVCVKDFSTRAKLQCNWWRSQELKSNAFLKEGLMCWKVHYCFSYLFLYSVYFYHFYNFVFFNIKTGKPKKNKYPGRSRGTFKSTRNSFFYILNCTIIPDFKRETFFEENFQNKWNRHIHVFYM